MLQFLCFYRSVSCKRQDNRELIRKNDETSKVNIFKDFLIKVSFPDFHFEKAIKCDKNQRHIPIGFSPQTHKGIKSIF